MLHTTSSAKSQIIRLLSVIGLAVFGAFALTGALIYYSGPSGYYELSNILLDPTMLDKLNYREGTSQKNKNIRYVFKDITFSYFDKEQKRFKHVTISPPAYQRFYQLIAGETSVAELNDTVIMDFFKENPATLTLSIQAENGGEAKPFQRVQFLPKGDYYRVELVENNPQNQWAYFFHPGIYDEAFQQFISNTI